MMKNSKPFDKELFYHLCEKYDVELSDKYDKPMLREQDGSVRPLIDEEDVYMKKTALVIDMPKTCEECEFRIDDACALVSDPDDKSYIRIINCKGGYSCGKPDWCPLKELPDEESGDNDCDAFDRGWTAGFNACLQRIKGEE